MLLPAITSKQYPKRGGGVDGGGKEMAGFVCSTHPTATMYSTSSSNEPFELNAHVSHAHPQASTSGCLRLSFTSKPLQASHATPIYPASCKVCSLTLCLRPDAVLCPIRAETCRRKKKSQPAKKFRNIPQRHPAPCSARKNASCSRDNAFSPSPIVLSSVSH